MMVAPAGPMYQAGTLSGNPLAMTAGIKTLELLQVPTSISTILQKKLADGLLQIAKKLVMAPVAVKSAVFGLFFTAGPVHNYEDQEGGLICSAAHRGMLEWYLPGTVSI